MGCTALVKRIFKYKYRYLAPHIDLDGYAATGRWLTVSQFKLSNVFLPHSSRMKYRTGDPSSLQLGARGITWQHMADTLYFNDDHATEGHRGAESFVGSLSQSWKLNNLDPVGYDQPLDLLA